MTQHFRISNWCTMLIQPDRYDTAMSVPRNAMVIHQSSRQGFPPTWGCDPEVIEADNDLPMIFFWIDICGTFLISWHVRKLFGNAHIYMHVLLYVYTCNFIATVYMCRYT